MKVTTTIVRRRIFIFDLDANPDGVLGEYHIRVLRMARKYGWRVAREVCGLPERDKSMIVLEKKR